jgi:DNA-binding transcriptional LysR family regulator
MNLETLQLFCEVVRAQSFSRGARVLGVSQSAASQAVALLEGQLGVVLMDRSKRPFALTPEGRRFFEGVRAVLRQYDELTTEVRSNRAQIVGSVRVAAIYSIGIHAMSRHTQQFMTQYPQAKVRLEYLRPNAVVDAVLAEEADLGLLSFPSSSRALAVIPLRTEKMVFVCPPTHRLSVRKGLEPHDLQGEDLVTFDRDLAIRRALDRALRRRHIEVNVVMEFDNVQNIKQALETGAGVAILPEPTVRREVEGGSLVAVPLFMAELVRPIGIIHRRRRNLPPVVLKFIEELKSPEPA